MSDPQLFHVRHLGTGPRRVLALHCTLAHGGSWRGVADAFDGQASFFAPDLPGHGRSASCPENIDLHDLCTEQAAVHLKPGMELAGHSFGATVALRLALTFPERIRSLTLVEPVLFSAAQSEDPAVVARYTAQMAPFDAAIAAGDPVAAAQVFNQIWGYGTRWDAFPEQVRAYMVERIGLVPRQTSALMIDSTGILAPGRLEALAVPTLLIEGEQTAPVIRTVHEALAKRLKDPRRVIIPEAGHMCVQTHPADVAAAMAALFEMPEE